MKKQYLFFLLIMFVFKLNGQSLQYSETFIFSNGDEYTIPTGYTLKIESMNTFGSSAVTASQKYSGTCMINCPSCGTSSGVTCYLKDTTYLKIGELIAKSTNSSLYKNSGGNCNVCPTYVDYSVTIPSLIFPIWLPEGAVIRISCTNTMLSALLFKID